MLGNQEWKRHGGWGAFLQGMGRRAESTGSSTTGTGADSRQHVAAKHRGEVGPWCLGKQDEGS